MAEWGSHITPSWLQRRYSAPDLHQSRSRLRRSCSQNPTSKAFTRKGRTRYASRLNCHPWPLSGPWSAYRTPDGVLRVVVLANHPQSKCANVRFMSSKKWTA
jgi:hypothetical protein